MKCYCCQAQIRESDAFCSECGAPQKFSEEQIKKAMQGDQQAITQLYQMTCDSVYNTVRSMIREEDTILDLVQDSYVKGFRHLGQLKEPAKFRAWMKRIAHNQTVDYLRKTKPVMFSQMVLEETPEVLEFEDDRKENIPEVAIDQKETSRLLKEILDSLTDEQRLVIGMYYYEQLGVREMAQILGCSENTVKSRLMYARKKVEAKVLDLEKQGTKLYGLAPAALLMLLFQAQDTQAAELAAAQVLPQIWQLGSHPVSGGSTGTQGPSQNSGTPSAKGAVQQGGAAGRSTGTASRAAGSAAQGAAKKSDGLLTQILGKSAAVKIAAGVAAVAVVGGGVGLAVHNAGNARRAAETQNSVSQTDARTVAREDVAEGTANPQEPQSAASANPQENSAVQPSAYLMEATFPDTTGSGEGLAAVQDGATGMWGFIDKTGQYVIEPKYYGALPFSEGRAMVNVDGNWGFIDHDDNLVIPAKYGENTSFGNVVFTDGIVELYNRETEEWTVLDVNGTERPEEPEETIDFNTFAGGAYAGCITDGHMNEVIGGKESGLMILTRYVNNVGTSALIDKDGNLLIDFNYQTLVPLDGAQLFLGKQADGNCFLLDRQGNVLRELGLAGFSSHRKNYSEEIAIYKTEGTEGDYTGICTGVEVINSQTGELLHQIPVNEQTKWEHTSGRFLFLESCYVVYYLDDSQNMEKICRIYDYSGNLLWDYAPSLGGNIGDKYPFKIGDAASVIGSQDVLLPYFDDSTLQYTFVCIEGSGGSTPAEVAGTPVEEGFADQFSDEADKVAAGEEPIQITEEQPTEGTTEQMAEGAEVQAAAERGEISAYGYAVKAGQDLYFMRIRLDSLNANARIFAPSEEASYELVKRSPDGTETVMAQVQGNHHIGVAGNYLCYSTNENGYDQVKVLDLGNGEIRSLESGVLEGANGNAVAYSTEQGGWLSAFGSNNATMYLGGNIYLGMEGNRIYSRQYDSGAQQSTLNWDDINGGWAMIANVPDLETDGLGATQYTEFMVDEGDVYYGMVRLSGTQGLYSDGRIYRLAQGAENPELLVENAPTSFQLMKKDGKTYLLYSQEPYLAYSYPDQTFAANVMDVETKDIIGVMDQNVTKTGEADWQSNGLFAYLDKTGIRYCIFTQEELANLGFPAYDANTHMASDITVQDDGVYVYLCRGTRENIGAGNGGFQGEYGVLVRKDLETGQWEIIYNM